MADKKIIELTDGGSVQPYDYTIITRNNQDYKIDLQQLKDDTNTYTTGATLNGTIATFSRNDGNTYNIDLTPLSATPITSLSFSAITDTPTTISGYGISDTYTQTEIDTKILWEKGIGNLSVKTKGTACAANNNYSVATGLLTTANGISSHAQNQSTVASGNYSNAAGLNTVASGTFAFSEGFETAANGVATHAAGQGTIAHDYAEFVVGKYNIPGTSTGETGSLFTVGNGINIYNKSNAFQIKNDGTIIITTPQSSTTNNILVVENDGTVKSKILNDIYTTGSTLSGTTATFNRSDGATYNLQLSGLSSLSPFGPGDGYTSIIAKNMGCTASGQRGFAFGAFATVSGSESIAMGYNVTANGDNSVSIGGNCDANGDFSLAMGWQTHIMVDNAMGIGGNNYLYGQNSMCFGDNITTNSFQETVIGINNLSSTGYSSSSWVTTDPIFTIGCSNNINIKHNVFQILKNGSVYINNPSDSVYDSFLTINETTGLITKKSFDVNYSQLKPKNTFVVSETGGDFTVISDVFNFVNNLSGDYGITIILDAGDHYLEDSYIINSSHKITFQGAGSNCCNVIEADELGYNLLNILTPTDFNGINFVGFGKTSNCIFIDQPVHCEILNCNFSNFATSIITNQGDLFIHNFVIDNCGNGIMADDGRNGYYNKIDAEVGNFINCEQGIYLKAGKNSIFEIYNCIFSPGYGTSNIGIVYSSDYYSYSNHPSIQGCKWDNTGHFIDGFDFTRHDGRDKNIVIQNNVGIESKNPHSYLNLINNTTPTTVGNNIWTKLNFTGTTVYENKIIFSGNRATYLPSNIRDLKMLGSGTLTTTTQPSNIELVIVKNGNTSLLTSPISVTLDSNSKKFQWSANAYLPEVSENDYFEIWGRGVGGTTENIILEDFNWLIDSL